MFDYFSNCSSNPHQVCCEDSPTNGLIFSQSDDLGLHSRSWLCLKVKLDKYLTCCTIILIAISRTVFNLSYGIQTLYDGRRMHGISAYAHFDDLDLAARWKWVIKGKIQCWIISTTKQATSIKTCYNGRRFFYMTLTLQMFIHIDHLVWLWEKFKSNDTCVN